ncbi:MAG: biopolymer transporter ExbD [Fuerstiella sp.]|jgi:biopolymer transport protein ExbD|nr:biopolymer transporter ExbD [Fuerstiella sp.]MCP4511545.1 biopolymer transporter ExbD [Fuerstiella sp.]MDG2129581.1 biopolymer transporter ExbD [Fuerstiella sp.]
MRLPTQYNQRTPLRFNITPLIDVVFLLIIFFLVASHFVRSEQAEPVDLPSATGGDTKRDEALHRLTVTVDRDGQMFISAEAQSQQSVFQRIDGLQMAAAAADVNPEVRLRADREARCGSVRELIEHCAARNIRSIQFAVSVGGSD